MATIEDKQILKGWFEAVLQNGSRSVWFRVLTDTVSISTSVFQDNMVLDLAGDMLHLHNLYFKISQISKIEEANYKSDGDSHITEQRILKFEDGTKLKIIATHKKDL